MRDGTPCLGCRQHVPEKDVWWIKMPNGNRAVVCPTCYSAAQTGRFSFTKWKAHCKPTPTPEADRAE